MERWVYEDPPQNPDEIRVAQIVTQKLRDKEAGFKAGRMWGLYLFLKSHPYPDAETLRQSILQDGAPMFTPREAEQVFSMVKQTGGAEETIPPEFFDKLMRDLASYTGIGLPTSVQPYVYVLQDAERNPSYGPLLGAAMDATNQALPNLATTIQNVAPQVIGALPIPSAGLVGTAVGWVLSSFLLFFTILMNISRAQFGSAFVVSLALFPVLGSALMNGARSAERLASKLSQRRTKLVESVRILFGDATAQQLDGWLPDLKGGRRKALTKRRGSIQQWRRTRRSRMHFDAGSSSMIVRGRSKRR